MVYLECQRCLYVWDYTGTRQYYATCPNCHASVRIDSQTVADTESIKQRKREQALRRLHTVVERLEREKRREDNERKGE